MVASTISEETDVTRRAKAVLGFCLISAAYLGVAAVALGTLVMSHCVLSDAQVALGQTCAQPADKLFWPGVVAAVGGWVLIQYLYLRWALRK